MLRETRHLLLLVKKTWLNFYKVAINKRSRYIKKYVAPYALEVNCCKGRNKSESYKQYCVRIS